ncbi:cytochrome c oxidase subunit II [Parapedobacter sp. 10938]|uniref:cytochrome c oxidase subunit II n=1 Tax=Parapedobacter flavus TaxID=3110225 RepID=UPI002DC063B2|nr:cytochrome c oxidase subunit II [Parapedobacter sp. 10938]MEC3878381.1 cytochrome c oxidase subunit II [Parapedobacter sp. 10938]
MGFINNSKFRAVVVLAFIVGIGLVNRAFSQEAAATAADTVAQAVDTAAVAAADTAAVATDTATAVTDTSATAAPATAAGGTTAAAATEESGPNIDPQVYMNFFYGLLLVFLICVLVGVIGKIIQVYELTRRMNGKDTTYYMRNFNAKLFVLALVLGLYGVYWSYAHHGAQSFRAAATEHGASIDTMFIITTVICTVVLVIMHIAMFSFAYIYRARPNRKAYFYPHNNTLEKIWTIVPAVTLTILVLFGFFTWRSITNVSEEAQKEAILIEVVGEQFMWTVRYPGRDGKIGERNYKLTTPLNGLGIDFNDKNSWDDQLGSEIVIPVNKPVRIQIGSKDILHSFYIPDFRVQMNAVPGMKTYFQFTATITTEEMRDKMGDYNYDFVMLCNKICGGGHYNMQKKVRVVTEEEYQAWLNEQPYFFTEDLRKEFQLSQAANDEEDANLLAEAN